MFFLKNSKPSKRRGTMNIISPIIKKTRGEISLNDGGCQSEVGETYGGDRSGTEGANLEVALRLLRRPKPYDPDQRRIFHMII